VSAPVRVDVSTLSPGGPVGAMHVPLVELPVDGGLHAPPLGLAGGSGTHVPLTRTRANLLLLFVALVWGSAFVAQAFGMRSLGPFLFTGLRFALGAAIVAPFAWREWRMLAARRRGPRPRDALHIAALGTLLFLGAAMQQIGMMTTTVTNAGFLTALYIPVVPVVAWVLFRQLPHWTTWLAALGCLVGTWLLTGGAPGVGWPVLRAGDWWVIASAVPWALHVVLVGRAANRLQGAMIVASGQFAMCSLLALVTAAATEPVAWAGIHAALGAIVYTGVLSVGIGFTLQVVAQRHARAADSAIVLSSETVFAATFGAIFMGDRLGAGAAGGCALILACILMVQLQPVVWSWLKQR
jgi:drug/metabolite transporter (DMT)-like permease